MTTPAAIREQLDRILASPEFPGKARAGRFLQFVVEETLSGRAEQLKGFTIALAVFDRNESFDSQTDPVVRIEAGRLRRAVERYYLTAGKADPILIQIPKGGYVPTFLANPAHKPTTSAVVASRETPARARAHMPIFEKPAVAAVPFEIIGKEELESYFSTGLAEEIIIELTRFQDLAVIDGQTAARYRGSNLDPLQIGRELGSLQKHGDRLRITARLADAITGAQLWAESYDRDLSTAICSVYSEVAQRVVAKIADIHGVIPLKLTKDSRRKPSQDLTVYDVILQYHDYIFAPSAEKFVRARNALEEAVTKEPEYSLAWAMLSALYSTSKGLGFAEIPDFRKKAQEMARRAVSLDPMCQQAHWAMALTFFHQRDKASLMRELERVLQLNPNAARYVGATGALMAIAGEWERGLSIVEKSISLNPRHPGWFYLAHYQNYFRQGEYEKALTAAGNLNMPEAACDAMMRAIALAYRKRMPEAREIVKELVKNHPQAARDPAGILREYVFSDDLLERMLEGLKRAGLAQVLAEGARQATSNSESAATGPALSSSRTRPRPRSI